MRQGRGRLAFVVLVASLAAAGVSGCGGTTTGAQVRSSPTATTPGEQRALSIRQRLARAGYTNVGGKWTGPGVKPTGLVAAFSIDVDFASPKSFHLFIAVFDTAQHLATYVERLRAKDKAGLARCRRQPACRQSLRGVSHDASVGVQRVIGAVFYSGSADKRSGSVPRSDLAHMVAYLSGGSTKP